MTGAEIGAVVGMGGKALGEDKGTNDQLLEVARDSTPMKEAAENYAKRIAIRQRVLLQLYRPLARIFGVAR